MKKWLINVLLKRGAGAVNEVVGKAIRHGMTTYGGMLMAQGLADASQVTALTGGALAVGGIIISLGRIWVQTRVI
jgi:hypothetical protein